MKSTGKCASGQRAFPAHLLADAENWLQYIPYEGQHKGAMKETEERVFQYMPPWEATFLADSRATDKQFQYMPPRGATPIIAPKHPVTQFQYMPPLSCCCHASVSIHAPHAEGQHQHHPSHRHGQAGFNTCHPRGGQRTITARGLRRLRFNTCPLRGGATRS